MREQQKAALRPRETWITLGDLSRKIGIHPDTLRSAARKVSGRQEAWVKKAPDARYLGGKDVWWFDTESAGYQELVAQWIKRADRLRAHTSALPLTRRARSWQGNASPAALTDPSLPGEGGARNQLLTTYLVSQGLEVYVNALSGDQETPWRWRWADLHGEGYGGLQEALIAALHSKMGDL